MALPYDASIANYLSPTYHSRIKDGGTWRWVDQVSVKSGGCAGMSYVMEYTKELNPNDEVIEDKGVKVFVDSAAIMYLLGTEMDYKKEELSSSFVFNNPNETERCGCGESFKIS